MGKAYNLRTERDLAAYNAIGLHKELRTDE